MTGHDTGTGRRRHARGRAAIPILAVLTALVLVGAACGGVSGEVEPSGLSMPEVESTDAEPEPDDRTPDTQAGPVRERLIIEGEEICNDELGGLQNLPTPSRLRDAVVQLRYLEGRYRSAVLRLRGTPAPAADAGELELIFVQIEQLADLIGGIAGALEARDIGEVDRLQPQMNALGVDLSNRMRAYGFADC